MKRNYFILLFALFGILLLKAEPSSTVPDPYIDTNIIPLSVSNKQRIYGASIGTYVSPYGGSVTGGTVSIYGSGAIKFDPDGADNRAVALVPPSSISLGSDANRLKYVYFIYAGNYNTYRITHDGSTRSVATSKTDYPLGNTGWTLSVIELPDDWSTLNNVYIQTRKTTDPLYFGNAFISSYKYEKIEVPSPKEPAVSPPLFSSIWGAEKVKSIFSNSFTNENIIFSFSSSKEDYYIDNKPDEEIWQFNEVTNVSMSPGSDINVSGMNRFHMDVWLKEAINFQIRINGNTVYPLTGSYSTPGDKWLPVDIKIPEGLTQINKIEILGSSGTTNYFIDNIYFYSDEVTVPEISIWDANKALGRGMNLGNGFEEQGYNPSGNTFTVEIAKELIDKIVTINAASGEKIDHIRIPVRWDLWGKKDNGDDITGGRPYRTDTVSPYAIDPGFMSDVKTVVDYSLSKGLKVVLNIHHYNTLYAKFEAQKPRFLAIWTQIADQFKFYDHNLYFEMLNEPRQPGGSGSERMNDDNWLVLIQETLPVMRTGGANTTRPILVTSFDWGSFSRLERLVLPDNDNHLIATVHIYNPTYICNQFDNGTAGSNTNIEWWDTQIERNLVNSSLAVAERFRQRYPNVPIHVGEFGAYKRTETDSRSLWISYLRDAFEKRGYSHAYWEFRAGYGLYTYNNGTYNQPIVDALLSNDVPNVPASHTLRRVGEPVIDLNRDKDGASGVWTNATGSTSTALKQTFKSSIWGPVRKEIPLARDKDAAYRFTFKASADKEGFGFMMTTTSFRTGTSSAKTSEYIFYPGTEAEEHSFIIFLRQNDYGVQLSTSLISPPPGESNPVTLTLTDVVIEEIEKRHEAAPVPELTADNVTNIFSSHFTEPKISSFSGTGTQSYIKDNSESGENIIQIANFANQTITLSSISVDSRKTLHLNAYAGSQMNELTVKVNGNGTSATKSFNLPSHTWQHLGIGLGNLTTVTSIELSGGTGEGRKLFLDNIYLQTGDVPENIEKIPAADIPDETDIVNFYSTRYGVDNPLNYSDESNKTTATDTNDNSILQFNHFTSQIIKYTSMGDPLDLGDKNNVRVSFFPEERFELSVRLIYYKDGTDDPLTNITCNIAPAFYKPGEWNTIDVNIEDFVTQTDGKISAIEFMSDKDSGSDYIAYLDHIYFYYEQIEDENDPEVPAYIPPAINKQANLISIFSNYYNGTIIPGFSYRPSGVSVMDDDIWRFKNTTEFSVTFNEGLDIAEMTHLHIDIHTKISSVINLSLIVGETVYPVAARSLNNEWLRLDIPLSEFNIADLSTINAIRITGEETQNYYVDNLYFYKDEKPFTASLITDVNAGLGRGINLGEILDRVNVDYTIEEIKSYIDKISGIGDNDHHQFDHIRLPVDWSIYNRSLSSTPYNLLSAFIIDSIKAVVDYALEKDLKFVITLSDNDIISGQIADYFRYYPENLLFEVPNNASLAAVRNTIQGDIRAVVTEQITELPIDDHLIISMTYKKEGLTIWRDIPEERATVKDEMSVLNSTSFPVYISALGISSEADMDSRALWNTYVSRYLEQNTVSWAYQSFIGENGLFKNNVYQIPIIDALLVNSMPEPTELPEAGVIEVYNSSETPDLYNSWKFETNRATNTADISNETKEITLTLGRVDDADEGRTRLYQQELYSFEEKIQYNVRFKALSTQDGFEYKIGVGNLSETLVSFTSTFSPNIGESEFNFPFTYSETTDAQIFFYLAGQSTRNAGTLVLKDIIIEKTARPTGIIPASVPSYDGSEVESIYSTSFGNADGINFPAGSGFTVVSEEADSKGNSLKLFTNFDSQGIDFTEIKLGDKNVLHISAYPGSVLHLTVEAIHESANKAATFTLLPHAWNELEIDLKDFLAQTNGEISELKFSGGTGEGRKLYLDHIYLFTKEIEYSNVTVSGSNGADSNYDTLQEAFDKIAEAGQSGQNIIIDINEDITETNSFTVEAPEGIWDGLTLKGGENLKTIRLDNITLTISGPIALDNVQFNAETSTVKYSGAVLHTIAENTFAGNKLNNLMIDASKVIVQQTPINITNNLTIAQGCCLEIPAEKTVIVSGTTDNQAGAPGLIIGSEAEKANATFIFSNEQSNPVSATVEMYSKAFRGDDNKFKWQHIGIPVNELRAGNSFAGSGIRQWNESGTTTGIGNSSYWIDLLENNLMYKFYGYEVTQQLAKKITFSGELVNSTFTKVLTYTDGSDIAYPGQHVLGNSYTASLDIDKIAFGDGLDKTVYLYNTGSFNEWVDGKNEGENSSITGINPGQYLAIPQQVIGSGEFLNTIPSMQGYLVRIEDRTKDCTITVNYTDVVTNTDKQRVNRMDERIFTYSRIEVEGSSFSDCMWLFTEENSSKGFDNGWDGRKFSGLNSAPQIWAREAGVNYQVNTVPDIQNTVICFKPGAGNTEYTLRFIHRNTEEKYKSITLHDIQNGTMTDVTSDGSEYKFTSGSNDSEERFLITRQLEGGETTGEKEVYVYMQNGNIFVLNPYDASGTISLYDVAGRKISKTILTPEYLSVIPVNIDASVYIIHIQVDGYENIVHKIIADK